MKPINLTIEYVITKLDDLNENTSPDWGTMSAQRMIEHLSDTFDLAMDKFDTRLEIPEDKIEKAQSFILSEHPMPQNFKASFAKDDTPLRNDEIELAIDEFVSKWLQFDEYFEEDSNKKTLHPYFGELDYKLWSKLNDKHIYHHLKQFNLVE